MINVYCGFRKKSNVNLEIVTEFELDKYKIEIKGTRMKVLDNPIIYQIAELWI